MRTFCIGNENCVLGMRLVGVQGTVVHNADHLRTALRDAIDHPEIALVLVTSDVAAFDRPMIDELLIKSAETLIVEVPGQSQAEAPTSLVDFVQRAAGVSLS